jgi:hypothetical protein
MKLQIRNYKKFYNQQSVESKTNLRTFDDQWVTMEVCNGHFFFWNGGLFLIGYTDNKQLADSIVLTISDYTFAEFETICKTGKL